MTFNTVWLEKADSRPANIGLTQPSAQLSLIGKNTVDPDDDTDANLSLLSVIPLVFPGFFYAALTFQSYQIKPMGNGLYEATVNYTRQDSLFTFDTGGGTTRITQSLQTRGRYGASGKTTQCYSSIVSGSSSVTIYAQSAVISPGMTVTGTGIPASTTVTGTSGSTVTISNAATATTGNPIALSCQTTNGSTTVVIQVATAVFNCNITDGSTTVEVIPPDDTSQIQVGAFVSGAGGLPGGIATVASVVDLQTFTLSAAATATGGPLALEIEVGDNTGALLVGESVSGPGIPAGATVASIATIHGFDLSVAATRTSSTVGVTLTFSEPLYLTFSDGDPNGAPDFQGAINRKDNSVEGVEVEIPAYHWEETYHVNPAIMTLAYRNTIGLMTGYVNTDVFRGLNPGEVKFMGARGSQKGLEDWEITFRFAASPNRTNLKVGTITVVEKRGWDYLWILYRRDLDPTTADGVLVPRAAYVEQVLYEGPFSQLQIGS